MKKIIKARKVSGLALLKCLFTLILSLIVLQIRSAPSKVHIKPDKPAFRHLTEDEGLTNSYVYAICQDHNGLIWMGTENGLYRYDGYRFYQYLNQPGDSMSINSNVVFELYADKHGNLWVGTFRGLMCYNDSLETFFDYNFSQYNEGLPVPVRSISEEGDSLIIVATDFGIAYIDPVSYDHRMVLSGSHECRYTGTTVSAFHTDREGNRWLATEQGVFRIGKADKEVRYFNLSDYASYEFPTTFVHEIYQDTEYNIWVTTREEGVFMKPANSEDFTQFIYDEGDRSSLGSNETYDIHEDALGQIWISTNGGGLNLYQEGRFIRIKHSPGDKNSLLNNNARTLFEDRQGNLWISSFQAGISIYINHPQLFRYYPIDPDQGSDYQSSIVCSIHEYGRNKLWVGTDGGGLKLFDRNRSSYKTFLPDERIPGSFPDKVVMTIFKDRNDVFWFGTYQGGLVRYNEDSGTFSCYQVDTEDETSINSNFVTTILEDSRGNLWIGTNGGGLNLFDRNTGEFTAFTNSREDPNSLVSDYTNDIIEDHEGNLWIGTFWGLSRFNLANFQFTNYLSERSLSNSLSHNTIFCLLEDSRDRFWIGTRNGLNLFEKKTGTFRYFTEKDGLAGNIVYGILEDENGFLWISTNKGISRFDPDNWSSVNFSVSDGLQGNEFFRNSRFKGENGELFFGGINGFNSFVPEEIRPREDIPPLVITGFRIFDQEVPIGRFGDNRVVLKQSINYTSDLKLDYSDKIFSFRLAAIDYITPENIVYAYKLEGFDNNWNYADAQYPVITYTNLNPGDYTLLLKAGNKNIIDDIEPARTLNIRIAPPFWKTWWAYLLYCMIILLMAYYTWRLTVQRIREREFVKMEILKREKAEELNQAKLSFFTNISHEFRTPLTLIIAPLEQLLNQSKETHVFRRQLDIMLKNARRLLRLINQLLDFRKFEGGKMSLRAEYSDIVSFIGDIAHSFEEYASEKQINFKYICPADQVKIWFDPDKLDKILFNLLSNAFKFTPESGSITLALETGIPSDDSEAGIASYLKITVSDTGKGIPQEDLPYLFDRFFQGENKQYLHQGSGLGLTLTKNFVEIHKGKIEVESSSAGTRFDIYLPEDSTHLTDKQKLAPESPGVNKYIHLSPEPLAPANIQHEKRIEETLHNKPTLLLVEDNLDLRNYLQEECDKYYNFYSASDGSEGYEIAVELLPDLIISDIMMPEMNGYDFCRRIKMNIVTSHIPVILLTAKSAPEDRIEGLESGADAYIPKPFEIDQLIATANSLIENRLRLREKFNAGRVLSNLPVRNTADDKFLQKVTDAVNANIAEVEFGVLELSKYIGISRVHLHRKLKAIANISPNELIKNIRLQMAGELLLKQEFTVSEVCYKVGFNSPAYFSSCFKAFYKMSPTEFMEKNIMS